MPTDEVEGEIIESVRREGIDTLESIVWEKLAPQARTLARLRVKNVGVDISDPVDVLVTERLTMLLNCGDDIVHLGNSPSTIQQDIVQASRMESVRQRVLRLRNTLVW